jgi:MOSC domain-containing protein YiiM
MSAVVSVNLARPITFSINGKEFSTGIFKNPVSEPVFLEHSGVRDDSVMDKRVHGGEDKACYLYPLEHYDYWKQFYAHLTWQMGMFGENITTTGLLELNARIGNEYKIGEAIVQVSQPRQPCFKLGYKFGNPDMVRQFRSSPFSGIYVRVIQEGYVKAGDSIELVAEKVKSPTILDIYALLTGQLVNMELLEMAVQDESLAESAKRDLLRLAKKNENPGTV